MMMTAIYSSEASVLTRVTCRHIPEYGILHSHRRGNLKPLNSLSHRNLYQLVPSHQFGFRSKYSDIDQLHRITDDIEKSFEEKQYPSQFFLDITQAFD
jgi:hypothetical protein